MADHQRQVFLRGQLDEAFGVATVERHRLFDQGVQAVLQAVAGNSEMRRGWGRDDDRIQVHFEQVTIIHRGDNAVVARLDRVEPG